MIVNITTNTLCILNERVVPGWSPAARRHQPAVYIPEAQNNNVSSKPCPYHQSRDKHATVRHVFTLISFFSASKEKTQRQKPDVHSRSLIISTFSSKSHPAFMDARNHTQDDPPTTPSKQSKSKVQHGALTSKGGCFYVNRIFTVTRFCLRACCVPLMVLTIYKPL